MHIIIKYIFTDHYFNKRLYNLIFPFNKQVVGVVYATSLLFLDSNL